MWGVNRKDMIGMGRNVGSRISTCDCRGRGLLEPLKVYRFPGTTPHIPVPPPPLSHYLRRVLHLIHRRSVFFFQMVDPEQPVDLGVRSDALEQVCCSRRGLLKEFHSIGFIRAPDIQKSRGGEREESTGGRNGRDFCWATRNSIAAAEHRPGLPTVWR